MNGLPAILCTAVLCAALPCAAAAKAPAKPAAKTTKAPAKPAKPAAPAKPSAPAVQPAPAEPAEPALPPLPPVPELDTLPAPVQAYILNATAAGMEQTAEVYEQDKAAEPKTLTVNTARATAGEPATALPENHRRYLQAKNARLTRMADEISALEDAKDATVSAIVKTTRREMAVLDSEHPEAAAVLSERRMNMLAHQLMAKLELMQQATDHIMAHPELTRKGQRTAMAAYYRHLAGLLRTAAAAM